MIPTVTRAETDDDRAACLAIRRRVFIEEQGVAEDLEVDGRDGEAVHLLARLDGAPVGTLRIRTVGDAAKLERVAVLAGHRGAGIGAALTRAALDAARAMPGVVRAKLGAQVPVIAFYERLGFTASGPVYDDAGIPHRDMDRRL